MTIVIGIAGSAGSGKSTVAAYLARNYGARVYALAAPLKEIVRRAFSFSDEQLYGTQVAKEAIDERYNVSPRWLMQRIGTEGVRAVLGQDFWTHYTLNQIERDNPKLAVIEDVRFLSEAHLIREWMDGHKHERGSWVWKLDTPWRDSDADPTHQSEAEVARIQADHIVAATRKVLSDLHLEIDIAATRFGLVPTLHSIEAP